MGRFIIGIMILTFYVFGMGGNVILIIAGRADSLFISAFFQALVIGFFIFGIPGILLTYSGYKRITEKRLIIRRSLELIRENGKIDIGKLAAEVGATADEVREEISKAQEKGKLPSEAIIA